MSTNTQDTDINPVIMIHETTNIDPETWWANGVALPSVEQGVVAHEAIMAGTFGVDGENPPQLPAPVTTGTLKRIGGNRRKVQPNHKMFAFLGTLFKERAFSEGDAVRKYYFPFNHRLYDTAAKLAKWGLVTPVKKYYESRASAWYLTEEGRALEPYFEGFTELDEGIIGGAVCYDGEITAESMERYARVGYMSFRDRMRANVTTEAFEAERTQKRKAAAEQYLVAFNNFVAVINGHAPTLELPPILPPDPKPVEIVTLKSKGLICQYGVEFTFHYEPGILKLNPFQFQRAFRRKLPDLPDPAWGFDITDMECEYKEMVQRMVGVALDKVCEKHGFKTPAPSEQYRAGKKGRLVYLHWGHGEVEIHGPIFTSMAQLVDFYNECRWIFAGLNIPVETEEWKSGGGHLHVDIQDHKWTQELLQEVFNVFAKYPFLNWVFNAPNDDCNANSIHKYMKGINMPFEKSTRNRFTGVTTHPKDDFGRFALGKSAGLQINKGIEFRIFDMPYSVDELKAQIMFLEKFIKYVVVNYNNGVRTVTREEDVKELGKWTLVESKYAFYKLLKKLGLNRKKYEVFVQGNLTERFTSPFNYRRT